jgi:hypothetical protein
MRQKRNSSKNPAGTFNTLFLATFTLVPGAFAQGTLIDQANDQTHPSSLTRWTLQVGDPVGQEFVPTLGGLDFVEAVFFAREGNGNSATLQVLIRDGSISGPILAVSSQLTFFASVLGSIHHFDFASTVPLTPGQTYVMHFFQDGPQNYSIGADPTMAYTSGEMIRSGVPFDGYDLWFREGVVVVPEPSSISLVLLGVGLLSSLLWRKAD